MLILLALVAQLPPADEQRVIDAVKQYASTWPERDRDFLAGELTRVIAESDAVRRPQALRALGGILSKQEPEIRPVDSPTFHGQFPFPESLRAREVEILRGIICETVRSGLSHPETTAEDRDVIKRQLEAMYARSREIIAARLKGKDASSALDEQIRFAMRLELKTINDPFTFGIDRPLTEVEIRDALHNVETGAAALDDLEFGPIANDDSPASRKMRESVERLADVVAAVGQVRIHCHGKAIFDAMERLEEARAQYRLWLKNASDASGKAYEESVRRAFEELDRAKARTAEQLRLKKAVVPPKPEPIQGTEEAATAVKREGASLGFALVGLFVLAALITLMMTKWK